MPSPGGKGPSTLLRRLWPVLLVSTLGILLLAGGIAAALTRPKKMTPVSSMPDNNRQNVHFQYTNMKGFFAQDDDATNPDTFNYSTSNLGLLNRTYSTDATFDPKNEKTQWQRFENYVRDLNSKAAKGESYKLLYSARHGEGWHNVEEANVGSPLWDCYWSRLNGNRNITWHNAELTPLGIQQALVANSFWKSALTSGVSIPAPESYYVSPLQRCLLTSNYTFGNLSLPSDKQFKPVIKELLREALGVHTCDQRDTKSEIAAKWPTYKFEDGFADGQDPLWDPNLRESGSHQVNRMLHLFDDIFANDTNIFISTTSHSGSISSMQQAVGHRQFQLQTGGVIPLFLKAEMQEGKRVDGKIDPPSRPSICAPPPGASIVLTTTSSSGGSSSSGATAKATSASAS